MPLTVAQFVSGFATSSSGGARANRRGRATVEKRPNYSLTLQQSRSLRTLVAASQEAKAAWWPGEHVKAHGRSVDGRKGFARAQAFG